MDGEWVAVCKMSNGDLVADNGYAYVSIAVQYMLVGVSDMRSDDKPMHFLTNFVIKMVEANENDIEGAKSKRNPEDDLETKPFLKKHKDKEETTKGLANDSLQHKSDQEETVEGLNDTPDFVEEAATRNITALKAVQDQFHVPGKRFLGFFSQKLFKKKTSSNGSDQDSPNRGLRDIDIV
ncbi:unnamed protein product [Arabidopsis arenosa]|uniref:Uncharacterized protein n=1 Tax=Arabidopsis arenosa TaxID=38785 RepID=A0A8S2AZ11_ARAAE|nr:unnamed protein product [Arabidopsis arenosa]